MSGTTRILRNPIYRSAWSVHRMRIQLIYFTHWLLNGFGGLSFICRFGSATTNSPNNGVILSVGLQKRGSFADLARCHDGLKHDRKAAV